MSVLSWEGQLTVRQAQPFPKDVLSSSYLSVRCSFLFTVIYLQWPDKRWRFCPDILTLVQASSRYHAICNCQRDLHRAQVTWGEMRRLVIHGYTSFQSCSRQNVWLRISSLNSRSCSVYWLKQWPPGQLSNQRLVGEIEAASRPQKVDHS